MPRLRLKKRYYFPVIGYPKWITNRAVAFFLIAFALCSFLWSQYAMQTRFIVVSIVSVLLFFYLGENFARRHAYDYPKRYERSLFLMALSVRLVWIVWAYYFNIDYYGEALGDGADTTWYMPVAKAGVEAIKDGNYHLYDLWSNQWQAVFDDMGYPFWLMVEYLIVGEWSDVFVPFVVKAIVTSYCAVCMYHVGSRHFGEDAGRLAGVFTALFPNLIYWCGTMFKEAEMVFLCSLFVDKMDKVLSERNVTFVRVLPAALVGLILFFFRSALGLVAFASVLAGVVMTSSRILDTGKKVMAGFLVALVLFIGMGDSLRMQATSAYNRAFSSEQEENMAWRSRRVDAGGHQQSFAKYAGAVVFAPLIFTIPFPTMVEANASQVVQSFLSGGNYIKNIFSFFVILVMFIMLFTRDWRNHVFILSYTLGYLLVLVLSNFAQSGRFHIPIMPMLMLFAAYGVKITNSTPKYKRWFALVFFVEVAACVGWNWFKLRGRGMI